MLWFYIPWTPTNKGIFLWNGVLFCSTFLQVWDKKFIDSTIVHNLWKFSHGGMVWPGLPIGLKNITRCLHLTLAMINLPKNVNWEPRWIYIHVFPQHITRDSGKLTWMNLRHPNPDVLFSQTPPPPPLSPDLLPCLKVWKFIILNSQQPILGIGVHYKYIETYFRTAVQ